MNGQAQLVKLVDSAFQARYVWLVGLGADAVEIVDPDSCTFVREPCLDEPRALAFVCRCEPEKHGGKVA